MMSERVTLENFESEADPIGTPLNVQEQQRKAAGFAEGYAAGEAAARAASAQNNDEIRKLASALNRKIETFEREASIALTETLALAVKNIFPSLISNGFVHEIASTLRPIAKRDQRLSFTINTASESKALVEEAIKTSDLEDRVTVNASDTFSEYQIEILWGDGGADLDMPQAVQALSKSLEEAANQMRNTNDG